MICQDHESIENKIIKCLTCGITVHKNCYAGSENFPNKSPTTLNWQCHKCDYLEKNKDDQLQEEIKCCFCTSDQGILKRVKIHFQNRWVHPICVELIPEIEFIDE